jgi:predicted metalloprotease with PDZ domain
VAKKDADGTIRYEAVTLERLCDSPLLCGRYFQEIAIGPKEGGQHWLCLAVDSQAALEIQPSIKASYDRLVAEGLALFGSRRYDSYRFLCSLSDRVPLTGLEHHDSSDNRVPERSLAEAGKHDWYADLLPHEFVHSWNGKFRRPAAMVVDDFQRPVHTRLLWVYEGLTQYLGMVLAARSGLWTPESAREHFARVAEWSQNQRGRDWRSLEDTAVAAQDLYGSRSDGAARRRGVDFYDEGVLIWLDADTLIREKTGGKKSLDDFCQAFFGGENGPPMVEPYDLEDVVAALNKVTPHDWQGFFEERVSRTGSSPPLDGVERGGWKLVYGPERSKTLESWETDNKCIDLTASLGLLLKEDGTVIDAIPGKAAEIAGVAPGMRIFAVNRRKWSPQIMRTAVARTKGGSEPLSLILENAGYVDSATIKYDGGDAYPQLERIDGATDRLSDILKAKVPARAGPR